MSKETTKALSFNTAILENIQGQIEEKQIEGNLAWHVNRKAGLARKSLVIRYQITQLVAFLAEKQYKKYRKHYHAHRVELERIDSLPLFVTNDNGVEVNNYNNISKQYDDLLEDLKESAELIQQSGKGYKLRQFKTKSKAVRDEITAKLSAKSDTDVIAEDAEAKAA